MPRSTREWSIRKMKEARNNLDWAGSHLVEIATLYEKDHPEISEPLFEIANGIMLVQEAIDKVRAII